jgi:uncharacterized protein YcbK (DUF882 family)
LRDFRTNEIHTMDPALRDVLFELRTKVDSQRAFHVISAYVRLESFPTERLAQVARTLRRGRVGYYRASDFAHLDTGRVRHW